VQKLYDTIVSVHPPQFLSSTQINSNKVGKLSRLDIYRMLLEAVRQRVIYKYIILIIGKEISNYCGLYL